MGAAVDPFPHLTDAAPEVDPYRTGGEEVDDDGRRLDAMTVLDLPDTDWAEGLRRCRLFFSGQQHDHLYCDWDGLPREPGTPYMGERWFPGSKSNQNGYPPPGFVASNRAPYGLRKPNASYPLPKQVVRRFTEMLFGEKRRPRLRVRSDMATERFLHAIFAESETWDALQEARDKAGSCGASWLSIAIQNGEPIARAHRAEDIVVLEWRDKARWEPAWAIEQKLITKTVVKDGKVVHGRFWQTKEWTPTHTRLYQDVPEKFDREKVIPLWKEVPHGCDGCPLIWYQNTRNTDSPLGEPDCDGAWHLFDNVDRLQSQTVKGSIANVDPTLKVKKKRYPRRPTEIDIGSGNAIALGVEEDASYLEMQGMGVRVGWEGVHELRDEALQTVGCVIVDPTTAGKGQSGEALEKLWRSMEARIDRFRVPAARSIQQLCEKWIAMAKHHGIGRKDLQGIEGAEKEVKGILLPPYVEQEDDPGSEETNEAKLETHTIGKGRHVEVIWPPHHTPTPQQLSAMATGLSVAAGNKPMISQETASHHMAAALGQEDPGAEYRRLQAELEKDREELQAGQFPVLPEDGDEDEEEEEDEAEAEEGAQEGKKKGEDEDEDEEEGK